MQSIQYFAPEAEDDLSSHAYRQAIGWLGVLLPWLLLPLARWRAVGVFPDWQPLDSISQYYYSGATALLTGALAALAIFFLTYRGFANESKWADQTLGKIAGLAALGVSFFPTKPDPRFLSGGWWLPWMRWVHYTSAVLLFGCFILYCLWLFPKGAAQPKETDPGKASRNAIYIACGCGMIGALAWAAIACIVDDAHADIFWPESLALVLFGWSWLTKGQAGWTFKAVRDRVFPPPTVTSGASPGA